jgi:hypothetical protein
MKLALRARDESHSGDQIDDFRRAIERLQLSTSHTHLCQENFLDAAMLDTFDFNRAEDEPGIEFRLVGLVPTVLKG